MTWISDNWQRLSDSIRISGSRWTAALVLSRLGLPVLRYWPDSRVPAATLSIQLELILEAWGMTREHIDITLKHVVYSDVHGIDSHGCAMLLHYHRLLCSGSITMTPRIEVVRENDTTALIDGDGGLGHVPADMAMRLAIEKCRNTGVGVATVRNSAHFGAAGAYAAMAAESDLVGFAMTNVARPALVPTHGVDAVLGTNPIAFSAPASGNKPFLLDMATTIVPVGKVEMARRRGRRIPAGWAREKHGRRVTNADAAVVSRRLSPLGETTIMGGHKGYGLAAMVEILSSVLPGNTDTQAGVGHFFLALDPASFTDTTAFRDDLGSMMDGLRSSEPRSDTQKVQVAGDPEYLAAEENLAAGIPLTRSVIEDIRWVCHKSDVDFCLHPTDREPNPS